MYSLTAVTTMVLPFMPQNSRILVFLVQRSLFASAWLCSICSIKGLCVKLQPGVKQGIKKQKDICDGCLSGTGAHEFFDIAQTTGEIPLYKKLVMADPGKVVAKAIRDSIAGREVSVYGIWMKVFWVLAKVFPHSLILDIMEKIEYAPGKERW